MSFKLRNLLINILLFLSALFVLLIFCEIALRFFCPKYQYAAESGLIANQTCIFKNPINQTKSRRHPDLNIRHSVVYNSLGFRQNREFSQKKPENVIRIGFFGDSYVENARIESQYSFTEPLDYLLNKTGKKFEVMNLAVNGYGTDQEYLHYLQDGAKLNLDIVVDVFCANDLRDIIMNNLLRIDAHGDLVCVPRKENKFFAFLRKFYITYFFLDINSRLKDDTKNDRVLQQQRLERHDLPGVQKVRIGSSLLKGTTTPETAGSLKLYFAIISEFDRAVRENRSKFYIVTLPGAQENIMSKLLDNKSKVLDLYDDFIKIYSDHEFIFKNDHHWNEEGNKLAAVFIFKFLAKELSLPYGGDEFIEQSLFEYYSSFDSSGKILPAFVKKHFDLSPELRANIRSRYLEFQVSY